MRPVKLTMMAFGPYAGTEVIDFREATDAGLFGIYGPTGSGKSSIFSAMTFALFGEGAKKEQFIATMRSGHADADRMTEVSLLFELGDKRYYVRRQPDQARPKKRGEGETVDKHAAWLFDATSVDVDAVTADNCGVLLAEKKVVEVESRIRDLLGYGVEQFRQIVLLPQGRFERFLISSSDKRVEILRELFDVSLYQRITKRMKDAGLVARREFEDGHRIIVQRLESAGFASRDELSAGIDLAAESAMVVNVDAKAAESAAALAEKAFLGAEALEGQFVAHKKAEDRQAELEVSRPAIEQAEQRKTRAERAQLAMDLDAGVTGALRSHQQAVDAEKGARDTAALAQQVFERSERALADERGRGGEIEALLERGRTAERHGKSLTEAADLKAESERCAGERDAAQGKFDQAEGERKRLEMLSGQLAISIDKARADGVKRAELSSALGTLTGSLKEAHAHAAAVRRLNEAVSKLEGLKTDRDRLVGEVEPLRSKAAVAERAFIDAQAQLLAALHLVDGEPCPVCGSADHPSPAHGNGDPSGLEESMRSARASLDDAIGKANEAEAAVTSGESLVMDRRSTLGELTVPDQTAEQIDTALREAKAELARLGQTADVAELERKATETKRLLEEATTTVGNDRDVLQNLRTDAAVAARSYQDEIAGVPEAMRSDEALKREVETVAKAIQRLRDALEAAESKYKADAKDRDTKAALVTSAVENVAKNDENVCQARAAFEVRLLELELSTVDYRAGRADVPEISTLASRIQSYRDEVTRAIVQAKTTGDAIAGKERPDMDAAQRLRDAAKNEAIRLRGLAADAEAHRKVLEDLRTSLSEELARLDRLERETGAVRALADAFDGQNQMRVPLETFAIGAMFDHVLEAANLRLHPMTAGRYRFERDVESVGGRPKRGLDIRVHDIQTGRPREISTLSGGETFIAALSLALGLSDIVEMSSGVIRLDTIFIDEGFGSLDTENDSGTLDLVLQVLQEIVGKSRAVGLISHVPLVQQAVPNGFSIVKGNGGSRIERRAA